MRLWAYCLMPNHWHFVVWPERDGDLPAFMQQVTNTHVKRWKEHRHEIGYGHLYSRALQVFPGGNRRLLLPGRSLRGAERPACKPVEQAESWRWSSLRRVEREDTAFPILSAWPLPRPTDWLQLVNQPQTEAEVEALRCCVNRGRPFGDPNWVTDTAERLGLNGRFGLVEDRRNNHKACHSYLYSPDLVAVTFHTLVAVTFHTQPQDPREKYKMPGVRDRNLRSGDLHEELGLLLLRMVALVAPVPRQEDVGTDAFATLVRPDGSRRLLPDVSF